jgi:hypothetical protein
MAVIKQGILGGFSGSVASVVGSSWKGINVMKAKPLSVANPRTAGQVAQRNKFKSCVSFAIVILAAVIKPLWDRFAIKQSGYNAFLQANMDCFDSEGLANPTELRISKGKMESTAFKTGQFVGGSKAFGSTWNDDSGNGYKLETDEVYQVFVNTNSGDVEVAANDKTRKDKAMSTTLTMDMTNGDEIYCYMAFRRADGTIVSDTSYISATYSGS